MKVAIVTDSNSGILQEEAEKLGITVIPMPFLIDGEEYFEDITLSQFQFFEKLAQNTDVSTSQPSIYNIVETWKKLLTEYDEVVHIPMSSGLSASMETAETFAKEFNGKVQVVDNKRISITQKQSVFDAIKLAKEGKSAKEIKDFLLETSMLASIYILVPTLKYLKKGGRVTPAAAVLGTMLKIKPILQIQGAKLDKFCQVISTSQARRKMIDQMIADINTRFPDLLKQGKIRVCMAYTNCKDKIEEFRKEADQKLSQLGLKIEFVDPLSLSVACHIGNGAIAIGCMYKY